MISLAVSSSLELKLDIKVSQCLLQPPPHALFPNEAGGHRGCDRMVVGFTTTCAIGAYHPFNGEMYLMQHYVVKCLSVLQHVSSTDTTDHHIYLK